MQIPEGLTIFCMRSGMFWIGRKLIETESLFTVAGPRLMMPRPTPQGVTFGLTRPLGKPQKAANIERANVEVWYPVEDEELGALYLEDATGIKTVRNLPPTLAPAPGGRQ